jgi:hypothetical protein
MVDKHIYILDGFTIESSFSGITLEEFGYIDNPKNKYLRSKSTDIVITKDFLDNLRSLYEAYNKDQFVGVSGLRPCIVIHYDSNGKKSITIKTSDNKYGDDECDLASD